MGGALECRLFTNYMGVGDIATKQARVQKARLCAMLNSTHMKQGRLDGVRTVVDVEWIRSTAYALIGSLSSFLSFRVVLPEAISVAPGLLTAAMRIKVVSPQSYLPGVFIVIMPVLYVPMIWTFCIFIVQVVGDPLLVVALTLIALSPLTYTALGLARRVTYPMPRNAVAAFSTYTRWCMHGMRLIALLCILAYTWKLGVRIHRIEERREGIAAFLLEEARQTLLPLLLGHVDSLVSLIFSGPMWSLVCTFVMEMYMTAIVGADWMLRASADEWKSQGVEHFVELQEQGSLDNRSAEELHQRRVSAMQAMLELTENRGAPAAVST